MGGDSPTLGQALHDEGVVLLDVHDTTSACDTKRVLPGCDGKLADEVDGLANHSDLGGRGLTAAYGEIAAECEERGYGDPCIRGGEGEAFGIRASEGSFVACVVRADKSVVG